MVSPLQPKEVKVSIPQEFLALDPQKNMSNLWRMDARVYAQQDDDDLPEGAEIRITKPKQMTRVSVQVNHITQVPAEAQGMVRKVNEHVTRFYGRVICLKRYFVVRQVGDLYVYAKPLFELERLMDSKTRYASPERDANYTRKRDQDYLTRSQVLDFFRISGVNQEEAYAKILAESARCIKDIVLAFNRELIKAPSINCFELFEARFQILGESEGYQPVLTGITSTPALPTDSSTMFALYPKMVDDLYDIVLDPLFPPRLESQRKAVPGKCPEAEGEDEEDVIARTPVKDRIFANLRWVGGRAENLFVKLATRW